MIVLFVILPFTVLDCLNCSVCRILLSLSVSSVESNNSFCHHMIIVSFPNHPVVLIWILVLKWQLLYIYAQPSCLWIVLAYVCSLQISTFSVLSSCHNACVVFTCELPLLSPTITSSRCDCLLITRSQSLRHSVCSLHSLANSPRVHSSHLL